MPKSEGHHQQCKGEVSAAAEEFKEDGDHDQRGQAVDEHMGISAQLREAVSLFIKHQTLHGGGQDHQHIGHQQDGECRETDL